ncbi:MAG: taurine catabolism dioxygenase TauD [Jatrophihabitantaceae bacterium]
MEPLYVLTDAERRGLHEVLEKISVDPYRDYPGFSRAVAAIVDSDEAPDFLTQVCTLIRQRREAGTAEAHVLRNCPIDDDVPELGHQDPLADKYAMKTTFIAEATHELCAQLLGTPLLAYATRFNGDFFTDVIAHDKYRGKQTGFSEGELVYHNDRTAHPIRADFISLLGMRCPDSDLVYTSFVAGQSMLKNLSAQEQHVLRQPHFLTPFDVVSRDNNNRLTASDQHPILENEHDFRYLDTHTTVAPSSPVEAKDALIALKNALARAPKQRHRMRPGDFFTFANQGGLHNRELIEVLDPERVRHRWLLKTYAFRDHETADRLTGAWVDGIRGRVGD